VFIWAVSHKKPLHPDAAPAGGAGADADLARRLTALEERLRKLDAAK
jgi:hypothetical protein